MPVWEVIKQTETAMQSQGARNTSRTEQNNRYYGGINVYKITMPSKFSSYSLESPALLSLITIPKPLNLVKYIFFIDLLHESLTCGKKPD